MALLAEITIDRSVNDIINAGTVLLVAAAAGGDYFTNGGTQFVILRNVSGGAITVTFETTATRDALAVADLTVVISDGEIRFVGNFESGIYNDGSGYVQITYSAVTTLTVGVAKLSASGGDEPV